MVVDHPTRKGFLCWENLTTAPFSRNLIDKNLLSPADIDYIDKFHQKCLKLLTPLIQDDSDALDYVTRQCAPL